MVDLWQLIVLSYPVVFVVTLPFFYIFKGYSNYIANEPIISFLEDYIIKNYGYVWFSLVYFSFLLVYIQPDYTVPRKKKIQLIKWYGINSLFFFLTQTWFFGPSIFERINMATGGHCEIGGITREAECKANGGPWINGFDSSGHFYFLISISLLVWREFLVHLEIPSRIQLPNGSGIDLERGIFSNQNDRDGLSDIQWDNIYVRIYRSTIMWIASAFLGVWYFMYLITCIFFHTVPEKIVGTLCGVFVPLLVVYFDV
ncbi:Fat storage-inducing transmembrane protein [Scheffersomyces xylosifermentans]|uniref:Fat storage-inducing transmembrane protein n=1 Tax=Scheffersomyces xylosifermentans TaxID=1304137 RepID=UPI00315DF907